MADSEDTPSGGAHQFGNIQSNHTRQFSTQESQNTNKRPVSASIDDQPRDAEMRHGLVDEQMANRNAQETRMISLFEAQHAQIQQQNVLTAQMAEQMQQMQQAANAQAQLIIQLTQSQQQPNPQAAAQAGVVNPPVQPPVIPPPPAPEPLVPTKAITREVKCAIDLVTSTVNRLNRKKATSESLNAIVVDEDFKQVKNPLPSNTPKFIKAMTAPSIHYPKGMAEDEAFTQSNLQIETALRSLQATVLSAIKLSAVAEVQFYDRELASIRVQLAETVTAHLQEMQFMSDERRQRIIAEACADFDKKKEAEIDKIESARVQAQKEKADLAKQLEDEKLAQLETTSNDESLAVVTRAVVREELALATIAERGAGNDMDEERDTQHKKTNAVLTDAVVNLVQPKNGRAGRAQKTQQSKKQQPKQQPKKQPQKQQHSPTGKGNGQQQKKGKGGRGAGGATKAGKKGTHGGQ
jgi:hypothetical protein